MRLAARIALGLVVALFAAVALPARATAQLSDTLGQIIPTPTLPNILPSKQPTPTPSEEPTPDPGGGSGGGDQGDRGGSGGGDRGGDSGPAAEPVPNGSRPDSRPGRDGRGGRGRDGAGAPRFEGTYVPDGGSYTTDRLVAVANRLRSLGVPLERIMKEVYAPFIIGGKAAWQDTWGAPRYGPGPIVRTHEGQDVFCSYGDPVLASEPGIIGYGEGGLGGKVARLFRPDGSYWYYAHLSDFNDEEFPAGSRVEPGDVIGYCGNTGNAISTPSHVHFGWYQLNGEARNPMRVLVRWLRMAERRALGAAAEVQGERVRRIRELTLARMFGDSFLPDMSTSPAQEVVLTAPDSEELGAFDLAQAVLNAAVGTQVLEVGYDPAAGALEAEDPLKGELEEILRQTRDARRGR